MKVTNLKRRIMSLVMLLAMVMTMIFGQSDTLGSEVQAAAVGDVTVTALATGKHHTLALDSTGHVWSWGQNYFGQLGLGYRSAAENVDDVLTPQLVSGVENVVAIAASYNSHSLALTEDGEIYAWGYNYYGQLGQGNTLSVTPVTSPKKISTSNFDGKVTAIAAGYNFSMAITEKGTLYTWGINTYGELGIGSTTMKGTPQKISMSEKVTAISAGWESAMVLTESGKVYVCGYGGYGEMGNGTYTVYNTTFKQVSGVYSSNDPVVQISNDGYHMLALTKNGTLWSWGKGDRGELGNGARVHKTTPQNITSLVPLKSGETITQIDAGFEDMAVLTSAGRLLACGTTMYGNLGDGGAFKYSGQETTLIQIDSAPEVTGNIVNGGAGYYKRSVIADDGTLYVTGNNWYGTLGTTAIEHKLYGITTVYTGITFPFESTYTTVTFDKNSDEATGTMDKQVGLTNSTVNLNKNEFERPGYKFIGWSKTANSNDVAYKDEASIKLQSDITLYAVWEYDPSQWATIEYNANTGDGGLSETVLLGSYEVKSDSDANVSKTYNSFVSWNTKADGTGTEYKQGDTIEFTKSETLTLYAIWKVDLIDITYDANGGAGGTVVKAVEVTSNYTVLSDSQAGVSNSGYAFQGWNTEKDGTGDWYYGGNVKQFTSDTTLYAQWKSNAQEYKIYYYAGSGGSGIGYTDTVTSSLYTIKTPAEVGVSHNSKTFNYWMDMNNMTNQYNPGQQITLTGDVYLWAMWQ
ncbi:MAG: InlB B-repeat-containing protein [Lachnospiraceae bacterium]